MNSNPKRNKYDFICEDCGITVRCSDAAQGAECSACGKQYKKEQIFAQMMLDCELGLLGRNDLSKLLDRNATRIEASKFQNNKKLEEIIIPGWIKSIGDEAFQGCSRLRKVIIFDGVETIGYKSFQGCPALEEIEIPASVRSLGNETFVRDRKLKRVMLHDGLETIGQTSFKDCSSLSEIEIPATVKELNSYLFLNCSSLKKVMLHGGLKTIGDNVFKGCPALEEIEIPATVESFGENVFGMNVLDLMEKKENDLTALQKRLRPVLAKFCQWNDLKEEDWRKVLSAWPEAAQFCNWNLIKGKTYDRLAELADRIQPYINDFESLPLDAIEKMGWGKYVNWDKKIKTGKQWKRVFQENPGLASFCNCDLLDSETWVELLSAQPQFMDKCPDAVRMTFDKDGWIKLLSAQPQFMDKCPDAVLIAFDKDDWIRLLSKQSVFGDNCTDALWGAFDKDDWIELLSAQPQFMDKCPDAVRMAFDRDDWNILLEEQSSLSKHFPFYDIRRIWNYGDYIPGRVQNRLSVFFSALAVSAFLLVFTFFSLWGKTGWFSLIIDSWSHALFSGAVWIVVAMLCAVCHGFIWGPFFPNRWLNILFASFASLSIYTIYHWSFFFSRWSFGLIFLAILSALLFVLPLLERYGDVDYVYNCALITIPYFVIFNWFVLSPVKCSGWLICCIILLFLFLLSGDVLCLRGSITPAGKYATSNDFLPALIPPLIIGIWFLMSPVSPEACLKMANSLETSFPRASQALVQKGKSAAAHQIAKDRDYAKSQYDLGKYDIAVKKWSGAAEWGDAESQFRLGECYHKGNGVKRYEPEAVNWYRKAAEQGHVEAQFILGKYLFEGKYTIEDKIEAVKWYREAAEQGNVEAQFNLGKCYEEGLGVNQDYAEAFKWYSKAAEHGNAVAKNKADSLRETVRLLDSVGHGDTKAMFELGRCIEEGKNVTKDVNEALKWYRKAAEQDNAEAQLKLAMYYSKGVGVSKDETEAVKWYRKAAEQGNVEAQLKLAANYTNGIGVSKNETEAVKWYRQAAEQDYAEAQFQLGKCFESGIGIKQDYIEAFRWYSKAAEHGNAAAKNKADSLRETVRLLENAGRGDAEAMFELSACFENGKGVGRDPSAALMWIRKAAEQGHAGAQYKLALAYENGYGVEKDIAEATTLYRKAAEQGNSEAGIRLQTAEMVLGAQNGNAEAQYKLALAYENGNNGVTKDPSEAVKWYRKAAEQGHAEAQKNLKIAELLLNARNGNAEAQYKLAQAYESGSGVAENLSEAMEWYRKAAEHGYAEAQYRLALAYENGTGVGSHLSEAVKWYRKAAEQGHAEAQYKLALAYETGSGVTKDFSEAAKWYRNAAEQNNVEAQYKIGVYYEKVKEDLSEAAKWYRKAVGQGHQEAQFSLKSIELFLDAQNGNAEAQYKLGLAYETGEGVEKDTSQAVSWFDLAAKQGHAGAKTAIQKYRLTIELPDGVAPLEMVRVTAGSFMMGATDEESSSKEKPHQATLTHDFYIARTEVTKEQSKAVIGIPRFSPSNNPVDEISWYDAMDFCDKLNRMGKAPSGWKFTLPTETQWEYAARGGYARIGKIWEWCLDDWNEDSSAQKAEFSRGKGNERDSTFRVNRGGPSSSSNTNVFTVRSYGRANNIYMGLGFRVALVPDSGNGSVSLPSINNGQSRPAETVRGTTSSSSTSTSTTTPVRQRQTQSAASSSSRTTQSSLTEPYEYRRALSYESSGNKDEAFQYFRRAADKGYAAAQYKLGHCYYYGNGVKKDYDEALKWYRKAADQGYAEAQYWLGDLYAHGLCGLKESMSEGVKWFRKAAEQGYARAQFTLGFYYENGWGGLPRLMREAVKWYREAAEQGHPDAQYNLGKCYYNGTGVDQDRSEGVKWIRKAADQGYEKAKQALGIL